MLLVNAGDATSTTFASCCTTGPFPPPPALPVPVMFLGVNFIVRTVGAATRVLTRWVMEKLPLGAARPGGELFLGGGGGPMV